jgi:hypothetical protein
MLQEFTTFSSQQYFLISEVAICRPQFERKEKKKKNIVVAS